MEISEEVFYKIARIIFRAGRVSGMTFAKNQYEARTVLQMPEPEHDEEFKSVMIAVKPHD